MAMALTKSTRDPAQVRLYHITPWSNLASIVDSDALLSWHQLKEKGMEHHSIAYPHLQKRRDSSAVPIAPGGDLHHYVPWSFAARSPMLYAAACGASGSDVLHSDIVHLVSDVQKVLQLQLEFVFTDGHPLTALSSFSSTLSELPFWLDWEVLGARIWRNTEEDGDRKRRRQAEFLIRGPVPWRIVRGIAVRNETVKEKISPLLKQKAHQPKIVVAPEWYYEGKS